MLLVGLLASLMPGQEEPPLPYLTVSARTNKRYYFQGEEGQIRIRITPRPDINISVNPDMLIRFKTDANLVYAKNFFTASELDLLTIQEEGTDYVYYNLDKEIVIPFKVSEDALIGRLVIGGEVAFWAIFASNHWCLKTYQPFQVEIASRYRRRQP